MKNPQPKKAQDEINNLRIAFAFTLKYKFDVFSLIASNVFPRLFFSSLCEEKYKTRRKYTVLKMNMGKIFQ